MQKFNIAMRLLEDMSACISVVIDKIVHFATLLVILAVPHKSEAYVGDYDGFINVEPTTLSAGEVCRFGCMGRNVSRQRIEAGIHPVSVGKTDWTIELGDSDGIHSIQVNARRVERNKFDFDHDENIEISLTIDGELMMRENQGNRLPISKSPIYIRVQLDGDMIAISAGAGLLHSVGKVKYDGFIDHASIFSRHDIIIDRYSSMHIPVPVIPRIYTDEQSVATAIAGCSDRLCHVWEYFDEEVETRIAMRGGRYRLALLPDSNGGYEIIYLSGAEIEPGRWKAGMLKGRLIPTPFPDTFTLDWIDSAGKGISDGAPYAMFDGVVMTLVFPIHKAKFRFVAGGR